MNDNSTALANLKQEEIADGDSDPSKQSIRVFIANEQQAISIDETRLIAATQVVLADSDYLSATISIAVVDDAAIHALNVEFLAHDFPTDVLSFVLEDNAVSLEGELVVSAETACRQAAEVGWTPEEELLLYVIHGLLHLVGYDDKEHDARIQMLAAEVSCLQRLGVSLPAEISRWQSVSMPSELKNAIQSNKECLS